MPQTEKKLDPQVPLKFKLFLTAEQRKAYRIAADITGKKSIANYIIHAINTYTAFLLKELETQMNEKRAQTSNSENQTASSEEVAPTVESGHVPETNA